jgi:hypothetical protein
VALLPSCIFASEDSSEYPLENSVSASIRQISGQVATFTINVIDKNSTINTNQSGGLVNATHGIALTCEPLKVEIGQGKSTTILCKVSNSGYENAKLQSEIVGLEGTGIVYTVDGKEPTETIPVLANSSRTFEVTMLAPPIKEYEAGKSYDYTIRLLTAIN